MYSIGRGLDTPLKIDKKTIEKEIGLFARILIDVDLAHQIPERLLIQRKELEFFVFVEVENCPSFCSSCGAVGHANEDYRLNKKYENLKVNKTVV